jgi:hypothetical protein
MGTRETETEKAVEGRIELFALSGLLFLSFSLFGRSDNVSFLDAPLAMKNYFTAEPISTRSLQGSGAKA